VRIYLGRVFMRETHKFIDLFAGIGGFHLAFHRQKAECVFASEINKYARETYKYNFEDLSPNLFKNDKFNDDILKITSPLQQIPDFDILCAGFPCQPFSQAGYKRGFNEDKEDRGNMFFKICKILEDCKPKAFFLENVRHLLNHDDGQTFQIIKKYIKRELGYSFHERIVKASDHGLPQHRARLFMVGFREDDPQKDLPEFAFPEKVKLQTSMSEVWGGKCERKIGFTLRVGGRGSGLGDRRNWDTYLVDDEERRLRPEEGKKMMGFPPGFHFPVSDSQALKQLGNSVAVNAVEATAKKIVEYLDKNERYFYENDVKKTA
jgi:DNA (cytosine-5)-methyltransferase 1